MAFPLEPSRDPRYPARRLSGHPFVFHGLQHFDFDGDGDWDGNRILSFQGIACIRRMRGSKVDGHDPHDAMLARGPEIAYDFHIQARNLHDGYPMDRCMRRDGF